MRCVFSSMAGSISSRSSLESLRFSIGDSPAMKSVSEMRRSGIRGESMDDIDELLELDDSLDLEGRFRVRSASLVSFPSAGAAQLNPGCMASKKSFSFELPRRSVLSTLGQEELSLKSLSSSCGSGSSPRLLRSARRTSSLSAIGESLRPCADRLSK